jgi:Protein of unknown function (DUF3795)
MKDRINLVAACGLDCGVCELYLSRNNEQLMDFLVSTGIPKEVLPCDGCNNIEGKCPVIQGNCATYKCAKDKGISFCSECNDFPCTKLAPTVDKANVLPHNIKVYNLCTIKKDGVEEFTRKSLQIKQSYFKGKMKIGEGPTLPN